MSIVLLKSQAQVNSTYTGTARQLPEPSRNKTVTPIPSPAPIVEQLVSIWTPAVRADRIDWLFVSATANGQQISADFVRDHRFGLIDSVNGEVRKSIDAQFNSKIFRDTAVTVSPEGVFVSATVWTKPAPTTTTGT